MKATTAPAPVVSADPAALIQGKRLVSLDTFRGITIAAMILVNDPGTWSAVYAPLLHATWHGWTPTDLVFPFFLFMVGVSITLAFQKRLAQGAAKRPLALKALKRSAIIFALGLLLAAYPFFNFYPEITLRDWSTLRIPGVLQRIAVCYLIASLLYLYAKPRTEVIVAGVFLFGYWAAVMLIPVPGHGAGVIDQPAGSLQEYLDTLIFGSHMWGQTRTWDPEGFLSTFPAVVTCLLGVWTGRLFLSELSPVEKTARVLVYGLGVLAAGFVWSWFFPINKMLWTSSYVLFTGGLAMCALGVCYWAIDVRGRTGWTRPFVEYGMNAITVYVLAGLLARTLGTIRVGEQSLQAVIFQNVFAPLGPPKFASLLYAIAFVLVLYVVAHLMARKGIIIKV